MSSWSSGRIVGHERPLKPKEVWAIRTRLQMLGAVRDLALFNLAIDSKLRAISVADVAISGRVRDRAIIIQRKTSRPVQFELTDQTREAVAAWIGSRRLGERDYLFPSRVHALPHRSTRQYGRIVERWVSSIGLDPKRYGTHSMRRTKAAHIYKKTGNLRAVQLLLGHKKLESTVQYLGIEVDDVFIPELNMCEARPWHGHYPMAPREWKLTELAAWETEFAFSLARPEDAGQVNFGSKGQIMRLFHAPRSCSPGIRILLEEIGVPHQVAHDRSGPAVRL